MKSTSMAMSSASSSRTPPSSVPRNHRTDARSAGGGASGCESCYYPGCRKDANCHCDICVASFNATRDLIQSSTSLIKPKAKAKARTKTAAARGAFPPSFDSEATTPPSTPSSEPPDSSSLSVPSSPSPLPMYPRRSSKYSKLDKNEDRNSSLSRKSLVLLVAVAAALAGLWLLDSGLLMILSRSGSGRPRLAPDVVRGFGEGARASASGFRGGLRIVERKLGAVVGAGGVSNCSSVDSLWKLNQEGGHHFFFLWRCVMYRTAAEELSVWGSPLQTSGLLVSGFSSRSITLLSGRITEWSDAKLVPILRTGNSSSSWTLGKWSSAAVQLERETWVLEYQRSAMFQGPGLIRAASDILRLRVQTVAKRLKLRLLVGTSIIAGSYYCDSVDRKPHFEHPT